MLGLGGRQPMRVGKQYQVGCQILEAENKTGKLKRKADGQFCDLVFGALNFPNSTGDTYTLSSGEDMLREGSLFNQYLREGLAKGEYGHPKPLPGMTEEQWFKRIMYTEEKNTCHLHTSMWIDMIKPYNAPNKVPAFIGDLLPTGPYGNTLEQQLLAPADNVSFSIRSVTDDIVGTFGKRTKTIMAANGFDYVTRAGLKPATKFNSPSLESDRSISIATLERMTDPNHDLGKNVSFEAAQQCKRVLHSIIKKSESRIYVPASSTWH